MDLEAWNVDLARMSAVHRTTGFTVVVEGDPSNPSGVSPGKFPDDLNAVEQAGLLRCGVKAIMDAAEREGKKRRDVARAERRLNHTPKRPVLSLKR